MPDMFDPTLLVAELARRKETVALCESLTGGLASAMLVDVPGASAVFNGALVTYATPMKHRLAGVPCEVLESVGPVSRECAREMALGVRERCVASWGLSMTGVAGPDSQDGHPVGEVWIGVADPNGWADAIRAHPHGHHRWVLLPGETEPQSVIEGDRQLIRTVAASFALETLYKLLIELQKNS